MKTITDCHLYGILDLGYVAPERVCDVVRQMIGGGIDVLQLRAKNFDEEKIQEIGERIVPLTEPAGVPLIINDFPELVPAIGAQGAHVGQDDRAVADARWRAGRALADEVPPPIIGKIDALRRAGRRRRTRRRGLHRLRPAFFHSDKTGPSRNRPG